MGRMTSYTVFYNRRMLPQIGSPFFGMALVTFQIDRSAVDEMIFNRAMGVVAIGTGHFFLAEGMMRLAQKFGSDLL